MSHPTHEASHWIDKHGVVNARKHFDNVLADLQLIETTAIQHTIACLSYIDGYCAAIADTRGWKGRGG